MPYLEFYDGFLCFVIFNNDILNSLTTETCGKVDVDRAMAVIANIRSFRRKPKLFFVQESAENKYAKPEIFTSSKKVHKEFFLVYQKNKTGSYNGFIMKMSEVFEQYAAKEDILSMLVRRCVYNALHFQVHRHSKPVVFGKCYSHDGAEEMVAEKP